MKYFKTSQYVPSKGEAWMYYECEDDLAIRRYASHIPSTQETQKVDKPVVKKLFRPESLQPSSQEEFEKIWAV